MSTLRDLMHDQIDLREEMSERAREHVRAVREALAKEVRRAIDSGEDAVEYLETAMSVSALAVAKRLAPLTTEAVQTSASLGRKMAKAAKQ